MQKQFRKIHSLLLELSRTDKLEIASQRIVPPDRTWLKHDIQSIMGDTNIPLWGGGPKYLWKQLVLTLSKQNVCLMKDTNATRRSESENQ